MTLWYVDNTASGDNDGSEWTHAWESFADIVWDGAGVVAGDTLYISGGSTSRIYREQLTVGVSGTSGNQVTITNGVGANHDGTAKIYGSTEVSTWEVEASNKWKASCTTEPASVFFVNTDDSVSWGTEVADVGSLASEYDWVWVSNYLYCYAATDPDTRYTSVETPTRDYGISVISKDYVTASYLEVVFAKITNIYFRSYTVQRTGHIIEHCHSHHCGYRAPSRYGNTIQSMGNNNTIIRYNTAHDAGRRCINLGAKIGNAANDCIIEHNEIYNGFHALCDIFAHEDGDGVDGCICRYNLMYLTDDFDTSFDHVHGLFFQGITPKYITNFKAYYNIIRNLTNHAYSIDKGVNGVEFYNNVAYGSHPNAASWPTGFCILDNLVSNVKLKNNIGMDHNFAGFKCDNSSDVIECDNNCWYNSVGTVYTRIDSVNYGSGDQAAYKSATTWDTNGLWGDPLFTDKSSDDFTLTSSSPCIDVGVDVGLTEDYDGEAVPYNSIPDIGAYEYAETALEINVELKRA